jgi:phosphatidylglycerophosphate synthase
LHGLAGAALLATGHGLARALLVHAASITDGMDGETARLQLPGGPRGALLDGVMDRVADAAILTGLGLRALDGHDVRGVLVLTVAATTGALLSMATKDRATALGLPPAPERALGWLLGGRDGLLLLVAVGALLGASARSRVSGVLGRTVSRILTRHGVFALVACDPVTGLPIRAARSTAHRYERDRPGDSREQSSTAAWT